MNDHDDIHAIAHRFLTAVAASGDVTSLATVTWYRKRLKAFLSWSDANADTHDRLDGDTFNKFVIHLKQRVAGGTLSQATLDGYYRVLRRFGRWTRQEGYADLDPARALTKPRHSTIPPKTLTDEERDKMVAASKGKPREAAMVYCLWRTGARANELLQLRWGQIKWEPIPARALIRGKRSKSRWIFFAPDAVAALERYRAWLPDECRDDDQPVWWGRHTNGPWQPLGYSGLYQALKRLAREAGVEHFSPHRWRHYFAVSRRRRNQSLSDVQDLLGHSSPETTKIYDQLTPDQLGEAYMRFV